LYQGFEGFAIAVARNCNAGAYALDHA